MSTPRRYRFDNHQPPANLPVHRPVPLPEQQAVVAETATTGQPPVVVQHIHQAPPDRTLTKLTLGAGIGAGAVAAGVIFLPLIVQAVHALVASLMALAFFAAVICWAVVQVVHAIGSARGQKTAETLVPARKRLRRR